ELFKNSQHWPKKVKIITHFYAPTEIESDPEQIKQVLWNLFLNASEAMPDGGSLHISTTLESETSPQGQRRVRITVRDTGSGFHDKAISHLFTPFFTTKDEGTGLGLAIVKRIIDGLKGEIYGSNHPEGGAEVTIVLPVSKLCL
ncbi:MAG TPA: ATP-binding protein, partial [Acidobacteriota bacterium]|nr:ATP-binding protein [Acidobacteriota bacterium]